LPKELKDLDNGIVAPVLPDDINPVPTDYTEFGIPINATTRPDASTQGCSL
jgi:hypothetical protein